MRRATVVILLLQTVALTAHAGMRMTLEISEPGHKGQTMRSEMLIEGKNVAMTMDKAATVIVRGKDQQAWVLDHTQKRYMVFDDQTMKRLQQQIEASMAQMEKMMAQMPPAQRAQVQQQMKAMRAAKAGKTPPIDVKKVSKFKKLMGKRCQLYELRQGGKVIGRAWVAPYGTLGPLAEPAKALKGLSSFYEKMSRSSPMLADPQATRMVKAMSIEGLALVWEEIDHGKVVRTTRVVEMKPMKVAAASFMPPKAYHKQELPQLGR